MRIPIMRIAAASAAFYAARYAYQAVQRKRAAAQDTSRSDGFEFAESEAGLAASPINSTLNDESSLSPSTRL